MRQSAVYNQGFVALWWSEKPKFMLKCVKILLPLLKVIALQTSPVGPFQSKSYFKLLLHEGLCIYESYISNGDTFTLITLCFCVVSIIASFLLRSAAAAGAVPARSLCSTLKNTWLPHLIDFLLEICKHLISAHNFDDLKWFNSWFP